MKLLAALLLLAVPALADAPAWTTQLDLPGLSLGLSTLAEVRARLASADVAPGPRACWLLPKSALTLVAEAAAAAPDGPVRSWELRPTDRKADAACPVTDAWGAAPPLPAGLRLGHARDEVRRRLAPVTAIEKHEDVSSHSARTPMLQPDGSTIVVGRVRGVRARYVKDRLVAIVAFEKLY